MDIVLLYVTCKDKAEAETIARALLEARLIACANLLPQAVSLYHWEGEIQQSEECILLAKTQQALVPEAFARAKALHSYACPCLVALPLNAVDAPFLQWITQETTPEA